MDESIYVIFWFDVEDYVTPEADDAVKRLGEILEEHGVRGVFKLVGEKLRVIERRGRQDVISVLARHEIGFHSDYHSMHPVISEYLKDLEWNEGVKEFKNREGKGVEDIQRVFGANPACYGQPGGAWAPQVYGALFDWGIPVYLDETSFIGLNDRPFWYCGILNILGLGPNVVSVNFELGTPGFIKEVCTRLKKICERLRREGGGVVSIYNHPCTLVAEEFWDGVNFSNGRNPSEGLVKPRAKAENLAEAGYKDFSEFVQYVTSFPDVKVITAREALGIYRDLSEDRTLSREDVLEILSSLREKITFYSNQEFSLSPAEIFWLVITFLNGFVEKSRLPDEIRVKKILGPTDEFHPMSKTDEVRWEDFAKSCIQAGRLVEKSGSIPSKIDVGELTLRPEDFFKTALEALLFVAREGEAPSTVSVQRGTLSTTRYISENGARDAWKWVVFPKGFTAPKLVGLARSQAWTLKPALPHQEMQS